MKTKHRIARIRPGLYNYRGYNIRRHKGAWVILNEFEDVACSHRTLRAMRRECDNMERMAARVARRAHPDAD
jgi:hypothetical protein